MRPFVVEVVEGTGMLNTCLNMLNKPKGITIL